MLLTQYKLSYTSEFRANVFEIHEAINDVYQSKFHKKQFYMTAYFAFFYAVILYASFYYITESGKKGPADGEKKDVDTTQNEQTGESAQSESHAKSEEDPDKEGGEQDDDYKKM